MCGTAAAASSLFSVTRTNSDPARASEATCSTVEATSAVSVFVMDCTTTGASEPTRTLPIVQLTVLRRWMEAMGISSLAERGRRALAQLGAGICNYCIHSRLQLVTPKNLKRFLGAVSLRMVRLLRLRTACRRDDAIHSKLFNHLSIVIERVGSGESADAAARQFHSEKVDHVQLILFID